MNQEVIDREFRGRDVLSASHFTRGGLHELFAFAERMKLIARREVRTQVLGGYIMGSFFFEESTRTRISSEAAFIRLGGQIVTFIDPRFSSMMKKSETFEDTIRTVDCYCDLMAIRTTQVGQAAIAASIAEHPVINCGDGFGEHPTQALLDCFTLKQGACKIQNIDIERHPFTIAIVGDLKYGRTVHSLVPMLVTLCDQVSFRFVAPDFLQIPSDILGLLNDHMCGARITDSLVEGLRDADAVYMLRPQLERMTEDEKRRWSECERAYWISREVIEKECKPNILITHPLPRNSEIPTNIDSLSNALYHRTQVENGVLIRMALCAFILGKEKKFP